MCYVFHSEVIVKIFDNVSLLPTIRDRNSRWEEDLGEDCTEIWRKGWLHQLPGVYLDCSKTSICKW